MAEPGGEPAAWAADFSYDYFRRLVRTAQAHFDVCPVAEAPQALTAGGRPKLILRNDVDVSLERALRLAEVEHALGARATYMVMINSPLYDVDAPRSRAILAQIRALGHEIGLHFDFADPAERAAGAAVETVEPAIAAACARLEAACGAPVRSLSFHRPLPRFLRGPLVVAGRVNAYARELMDWYLSDSGGRWRQGEPLPMLAYPARPALQLLTHPIWWGETHQAPADRLEAFFAEATAGLAPAERARYDAALGEHIQVWRRGAHHPGSTDAQPVG
ncbi:MAG TPA: hypothetical protein VFE37_25195 [Chloroflexota bacterium]|nr:hypothetical protein [Chloroflexota bacterium]